MAENKVVIIGIDGATFDLIDPWVKEGYLPNIKRLLNEGTHGKLKSSIPPLSPIAWTSFMTGANPGKHGILNFGELSEKDPRFIKFVKSQERGMPPFWMYTSREGLKNIVINVPMTYPPDKVESIMISGMDAPEGVDDYTYPRELYEQIESKVRKYVVDITLDSSQILDREKYVADVIAMNKLRTDTALKLMEDYAWDLFVIVFVATDRVQHDFWHDMLEAPGNDNPVFSVYKEVDRSVGALLDKAPEKSHKIIVSDHGSATVSKTIVINKFLEKKGYLKYKNPGALRKYIFKPLMVIKSMFPESIKKKLKSVFKLKISEIPALQLINIDWGKTRAFHFGPAGNIYINLKGRNPQGIVNAGEEYENLRDKVISDLLSLVDPDTGLKVIRKAHKREEIYSGQMLEKASDIVLEIENGYTCNDVLVEGKVISSCNLVDDFFWKDNRWSSDHEPNGILIMSGDGIKKENEIEGAEIIDIMPTLFYILSIPIPDNLDGKVLVDAFEESVTKGRKPVYTSDNLSGYSASGEGKDETENIKDRLKGLGYMG